MKKASVSTRAFWGPNTLREEYGPGSLCIPIIISKPEVPAEAVTMHTVYTALPLSLWPLPRENTLILLTVKALWPQS